MVDARTALTAGLQRAALFVNAPPEAINALSSASVQRNWVHGELVFDSGDKSDGFYILLDGQIRLSLTTENGSELTIRDVGGGDIFGEMGALDGGPRSAGARTFSARATTGFVSAAHFATILRAHPALLLDIAIKLSLRLRETTEQLEGIALYPLRQRLARFIQSRGIANGRQQKDGRRAVSLPLSQSELAMILGASRPKLNSALVELERAGIIERRGSLVVYIPDAIASEARG
jgi:CRP/FNR family transcriptional regulator, cyclic AMP receptor protein